VKCRFCASSTLFQVVDLGYAPPSNAYLSDEDLRAPEVHLPLRIYACSQCWLVQTEDYAASTTLFTNDYAYFSSTSESWLRHAHDYTNSIVQQLTLKEHSLVIELASNDGYLLKNFVSKGIPCLGIEPTKATAVAAEKIGIPVLREFFTEALGKHLAATERSADLVIGNNVYAHVPDINDFTAGMARALKPEGVITLEFPHLLTLIDSCAFDTIYHEHYSYLSLSTVQQIFASHSLRVWKVEKLTTHGGSLRVYGCHEAASRHTEDNVKALIDEEIAGGLRQVATYSLFRERTVRIKHEFLRFLLQCRKNKTTVAAYGAAAKGSTLLNFSGVTPDLLPYVCDAAASKQGKYLPGSHIPILSPKVLSERQPDIVLLLPWNLRPELTESLDYVKKWGGTLATAIPSIELF
jgi:SAM-dependent methyltransferase